jgi:hypothetical protein
MKRKKPKFHLKLQGKVLSVFPVNKHGKRGKGYHWEIRENGKLPSALFFHLRNYVTKGISDCHGENLSELRKAARAALREAAKACGCKPRRRCMGGDLVFYLKGQPLIAFVVPRNSGDYVPARELLESEVIFRWIVRVESKKYFTFIPLAANKKRCLTKHDTHSES